MNMRKCNMADEYIYYENAQKYMVWKCGSEMCDINQEHIVFGVIYLFCS